MSWSLLLMMSGDYGALILLVLELLDPDDVSSCCFSSLLSGNNLPSPFVLAEATTSLASFSCARRCCFQPSLFGAAAQPLFLVLALARSRRLFIYVSFASIRSTSP